MHCGRKDLVGYRMRNSTPLLYIRFWTVLPFRLAGEFSGVYKASKDRSRTNIRLYGQMYINPCNFPRAILCNPSVKDTKGKGTMKASPGLESGLKDWAGKLQAEEI